MDFFFGTFFTAFSVPQMTCEEDLAFRCASILQTYIISEYGRIKMAGTMIPPIDKLYLVLQRTD